MVRKKNESFSSNPSDFLLIAAYPARKRITLLEKIIETGSITKAARAAGMSYKSAWDAINEMNNLSEQPLLETASGGRGGGGSKLTGYGKNLVAAFKILEAKQRALLDELNGSADMVKNIFPVIRRLWMKTSARNQLVGTVVEIKKGAVNAEVVLQIKGGDRITAIITNESLKDLGLAIETEVYALIKASWVILARDDADMKLSARNRLKGTIVKITEGKVNDEVAMRLAGGSIVTAVITRESLEEMRLKEGENVTALFKASSVILGVSV